MHSFPHSDFFGSPPARCELNAAACRNGGPLHPIRTASQPASRQVGWAVFALAGFGQKRRIEPRFEIRLHAPVFARSIESNCPTRAQAARFPYDQVPVPPRLSTTNVAKSASWRSSVLSLAKTRSDSRRTHKCPGRWRRSWTSDGRRTMHRSGAQTERLVSRKTLARAQITFQSRRLRDRRC